MAYRGRLLMAVQAEFGESASEAGIRQVEVEPTAPISDVSSYVAVKQMFWCEDTETLNKVLKL